MKFSVNWVDGARNRAAEERATVGELRIMVGEENSCAHWDYMEGVHYESVTIPVIYLAEGIATDWWTIFGGRDRKHPIRPYRTGFILPCLSFSCDGSTFEVSGEQMRCDNPGLRFWGPGVESLPRSEAESELSQFVEEVINKLAESGISDTEVELQWKRVSASMQDPDESAFCEAAGSLGISPYSVSDDEAGLILEAGSVLAGTPLNDFLAGVREFDERFRRAILESVVKVGSEMGDSSRLPDLAGVSAGVHPDIRKRLAGEGAWGPGYRAARVCRDEMGIDSNESPNSVQSLAGRLGNKDFGYAEELTGVDAVVSRLGDTYVHLRQSYNRAATFENFTFARAIGDAVCFPESGPSVVNRLNGTERQAMGRAFAAEFLAPAEEVMDMSVSGWNSDEIASIFAVSSQVIDRQIENHRRIQQACSQM